MDFQQKTFEIFKKVNSSKNLDEMLIQQLLANISSECEKSKLTSLLVLPDEINKMFAMLASVQSMHATYNLSEMDILVGCLSHMISCIKAVKVRVNPVVVKTWCDAGAPPKKTIDETVSFFEVRSVLFKDWEISRKEPRQVPFGDNAVLRSSMPWPDLMKTKDVPFSCLKLKNELRIKSDDILKL